MTEISRKIPEGLPELLQGFIIVCLKEKVEKQEDFVAFAAEYFSAVSQKKKSLSDHGVEIEKIGVDFFISANEWNCEI